MAAWKTLLTSLPWMTASTSDQLRCCNALSRSDSIEAFFCTSMANVRQAALCTIQVARGLTKEPCMPAISQVQG